MPIGETRRFKRVAVDLAVTFLVHESLAQEVHPKRETLAGKLADISQGGCLIVTDLYLPKGTSVALHVEQAPFSPVVGKAVDTAGKISMVKMVARKQYKLGVEFTELEAGLRKSIGAFCGD